MSQARAGAADQHKAGTELLAMRAIPAHPHRAVAGRDQLRGHLAVGQPGALVAVAVLAGSSSTRIADAAPRGIEQRAHQLALRQIQRRDIDAVVLAGRVDARHQRLGDRRLAQHARRAPSSPAWSRRLRRCAFEQPLRARLHRAAAAPAGELRHHELGFEQRLERRARQMQRRRRMQRRLGVAAAARKSGRPGRRRRHRRSAAGGGCADSRAVRPHSPIDTPEGPTPSGLGQSRRRPRPAPPAAAQLPERSERRVRRAQPADIDRHHVDAGIAQPLAADSARRPAAALAGSISSSTCRPGCCCLGLQQCIGQMPRQPAAQCAAAVHAGRPPADRRTVRCPAPGIRAPAPPCCSSSASICRSLSGAPVASAARQVAQEARRRCAGSALPGADDVQARRQALLQLPQPDAGPGEQQRSSQQSRSQRTETRACAHCAC